MVPVLPALTHARAGTGYRTAVLTSLPARGAGVLLGGLSGAVALVRPAGRTLHPRGRVLRATLRRDGARPPTGVPWLDGTGTDEVLVRVSRSLGLPEPLPDVAGLAIRVPLGTARYADLLLSASGTDVVTRHLLRPGTGTRVPMSTLWPSPSPTGPLLLGVVPAGDDVFTLRVSRVGGGWRDVGRLDLLDDAGPEHQGIRFDPFGHVLPGLPTPVWERALREPAYRAARLVAGRGY